MLQQLFRRDKCFRQYFNYHYNQECTYVSNAINYIKKILFYVLIHHEVHEVLVHNHFAKKNVKIGCLIVLIRDVILLCPCKI